MISTPLAPIKIENPICQEKRIEDVDLLKQLPIPIFSSIDAGPYITMGLVYAKGRKNGEVNCSVHRFCIHGKDTMSIWMTPTRHLTKMYNEAISLGESLPISINIGLDPAIYFASCFSDPFLQYGENELYLAGSIRKSPVLISECLSVKTDCISNAEIVIEAEITNQRVDENSNSQYEFSFGEFLDYHGHAQKSIPLVKAKMITHRNDPLYQSVLGPGYEQSELLGIAAETTIYSRIIRNIDIELKNVYYSPVGGGLLFLVIQIKKNSIWDDTKVRQVGLLASSETMVKHIMLVDEDVNVYSADELLWALTTRFQVEKDLIQINNMPGFPADPTQSPEYLPALSISGTTSKLIFDCTVPYKMKNKFKRSFN